jgi:hypothetical protein
MAQSTLIDEVTTVLPPYILSQVGVKPYAYGQSSRRKNYYPGLLVEGTLATEKIHKSYSIHFSTKLVRNY